MRGSSHAKAWPASGDSPFAGAGKYGFANALRESRSPSQRGCRFVAFCRELILRSTVDPKEGRHPVTVIWFVIWFIADHVGDREPLVIDPVNVWAATLILAAALDINRPRVGGRRGRSHRKGGG